jgi:peroxiredoxin
MRKLLTFLCFSVFLFSSLAYAAGESDVTRAPSSAEISGRLYALGFQVWRPDNAAPAFTLQNLAGRDISLKNYRGKIVLLNFWATWCPPCRSEMPSMEKLYRELEGSAFEMLAVDLQESPEQVRRFVESNGYSFPVLLDTTGRTGAAYQVSGIPTTYIIDKDGNVLASTVGAREWHSEEIIALFNDLVK